MGSRGSAATGTSPVTGIAQRNAGVRATASVATEALAGVARGLGAGDRTPSVRTVIPSPSNPTTTVPSRSVLSTRAPEAARRSSVDLAG